MPDDIKGSEWSASEVSLCVATYLELLARQIAGQHFNKAAVYRRLSAETGRTEKSIEYKFQNVSAVLDELGFDWITGLAPLRNYQKLLANAVGEHEEQLLSLSVLNTGERSGFSDAASLYFEPAPERATAENALPEFMTELIRKFDPVERDMRNRSLGEAGEELIFGFETRFLQSIGRDDLARNIRWVSKLDGDGAGYDILSFTDRGDEKHIEVKTTVGGNRTPFFVSRNEHRHAIKFADQFRLVRVFDFRKSPRAFELAGQLENYVRLSTETYRADFSR
jgi:hypothetical protein